jgi:hypothetical protein
VQGEEPVKGVRQKSLGFYDVLDTFQNAKGCALCELEDRSVRRYLGGLLYESVNDVGVRGELVRSRGYCHRHAHVLVEFKEGLATAILHQDQVKLFLGFLKHEGSLPVKLRSRRGPDSWHHAGRCPACVIQAQSRQGYVRALLDWLNDADLRKAIEESPGLCVPHLLLALRQAPDARTRKYLVTVHIGKFSDLANDLAEYIRKHDYRLISQGFGKEKGSWLGSVNMMTGRKDVF